MKKNLILLTGIVFLITILAAGGCSTGKKQNGSTPVVNLADSTEAEKGLKAVEDDPTTVIIYLKDREINGIMHLEMSDSRKPDCSVIDNLETVVTPGDTIIFKKAQHSKVKEVTNIRVEYKVEKISLEDFRVDSGLYVLVLDPHGPWNIIVKYDIEFFIKKDTTYTIDPYLKIPPPT